MYYIEALQLIQCLIYHTERIRAERRGGGPGTNRWRQQQHDRRSS